MSKIYEVDREATIWVRETYVLEWTDEENLAFIKAELEKAEYDRAFKSSETLTDTLEEIPNGRLVIQRSDENGDTLELFSR